MLPFRPRFLAGRIANPSYYRRLSEVLARPHSFFSILMAKLLPSSSTRPVDMKLIDGKTLRVREFWSLFLFDEIFMQNCYESPEVLRLGPFGTIIDIGANIGCFTLRSKQLWPQARVVAIEPHPENFNCLLEHIEINHLTDVHPLRMGVAEKCGSLDLYLSPRNIGGHSMYKKSSESIAISVPVSTLGDVMSQTDTNDSGLLLKIDCEGCEHPVLSSLTRQMADRISCIIFEPEPSCYDLSALLEHLSGLGFQLSKFGQLFVAFKEAKAANGKGVMA
jgi:FkbM family methyltransferase